MGDTNDKFYLYTLAAQAFSPSAPIDKKTLFAGRTEQIKDVINAISQRGQHIILFGERGVGKTSLANVISDFIPHMITKLACGSINCDPTMTFSSLWHNVFSQLKYATVKQEPGFSGAQVANVSSLNDHAPEIITPEVVREFLSYAGKSLIIIDEVDRLEDEDTKILIADTIKTLSDHSIDTTIILVGVADSIEALIRQHQSIERALVQIRMQRMSINELFEIIDKGMSQVGLEVDQDEKERIALLSQGLPHYTHLLALHASQVAIDKEHKKITEDDINDAVQKALKKAQQSILSLYYEAVHSTREKNIYKEVLLACAVTKTDKLGYFSAVDVREPLSLIMKKVYDIPTYAQHLKRFCEKERGPILQKTGAAHRFRFRFINPLLQPYVIMQGIADGMISKEDLQNYDGMGA